MRDALLLLVILAAMGVTLRYPFAGVLTWAWFALMTPHQMAYGVYGLPLNLIIAGVTIGSIVMRGGFKKGGFDKITVLMLLFSLWLVISQIFSLQAETSAVYFDRFIKTMLFVIICAQMANDRLRLHALIWMLTISLGYFAAKGALFTLVTLGEYRVQGIELSVLEDNNHMGIALATSLPLILYLRGQVANSMVRLGLSALFVMTIISIIGTHSRGAFLSLMVFCGFYWLQSKHKIAILAALFVVMIPAISFMPAKWTERMASIGEATQDASFMGRVDAWVINAKFAGQNPITGAGLRVPYDSKIAMTVDAKRAPNAKAAHSIYMEVLGGTGVVGLLIYLSLLATAFFTARGLYFRYRKNGPSDWRGRFGYYAQIALAVFGVGGASVSLEMWDGYWLIIAMIAAAARLSHVQERQSASSPNQPRETTARSWRMRTRGPARSTPPQRETA